MNLEKFRNQSKTELNWLIKIFLIFLLMGCLACDNSSKDNPKEAPPTEITFDAEKWKTKEDKDYPYRDSMLKNLMTDDSIRQLNGNQVLELLGEPTRIDSLYLFYRISEKHIKFFTLHTKTLVIKLNDDSTINWMKIHE